MEETGAKADPLAQPASQMIRELVGADPKIPGMNPYNALNLLLEAYAPGKKPPVREPEQQQPVIKPKKAVKKKPA